MVCGTIYPVKQKVKKMNERMTNELNGLANKLGISSEEMTKKMEEIATANALDLENEKHLRSALALTRQFVRSSTKTNTNTSSGSFGDMAFGFVVGAEPARDIQEWSRKTLLNDYNANANTVFNEGRVAEVVEENGVYEKSQIRNGDVETKVIPSLPNCSIEVDEGKWIVPLDNVEAYSSGDKNKRFGKPLPAEEWRRRVHFIGKKENGDYQYWTLGLKDSLAKNWTVEPFRWFHIHAYFNDERNACYGIKTSTLGSIRYNDNLDAEDDLFVGNMPSMEDLLAEHMEGYVADLMEIEDYHQQIMSNPGMKLCITDGIVSSMNLTVNEKTGNRVIWIEPADGNYGFEEEEIPDSTPCWIPSNVDIDFGVGSDVIVIGRTNQSRKKDSDGNVLEDEWNPVSLNVYGILPRIALGVAPEVEEANSGDEELSYW
jgi:hypothetical protein